MVLFTVSMAGFLLTQIFWIRNTLVTTQETFHHTHHHAARNVAQQLDQLLDSVLLHDENVLISHGDTISWRPDSLISAPTLEGLMQAAFSSFEIHHDYGYAIVDQLTGELYHSTVDTEHRSELMESPYRHSLPSISGGDRFELVLWFPKGRLLLLQSVNNWLLLLSVLLFLGIIAGYVLSSHLLMSQKRLARMQKDFINNTTHEFKTPLASISVAAEMIMAHRGHMPDSQVARYASIIYDENKRLQRQVDRVLQLSLVEEESYQYNREMASIQPLLEKAVNTARMILRDKGGEIRLAGTFDGELFIDRQHVLNVFNNLIDNGIKYSKGDPSIQVTVLPQDDGVYFRISDRGIGIPVEEIDRIFERMYRIPTDDRSQPSGTGIGLYYVRKVIEAHDGSILVNSILGEGTCFELYFPYPPV